MSLAGRAGDRLSERVLERAGAAWEEQRELRILIDEQSGEAPLTPKEAACCYNITVIMYQIKWTCDSGPLSPLAEDGPP